MTKRSIVKEASIHALEYGALPAEATAFAKWANDWFTDAGLAWQCWRGARDA